MEDCFIKIGEGDFDWVDVRKVFGEIGFIGWVVVEVGGGDVEWFKEILVNMDWVFGFV